MNNIVDIRKILIRNSEFIRIDYTNDTSMTFNYQLFFDDSKTLSQKINDRRELINKQEIKHIEQIFDLIDEAIANGEALRTKRGEFTVNINCSNLEEAKKFLDKFGQVLQVYIILNSEGDSSI